MYTLQYNVNLWYVTMGHHCGNLLRGTKDLIYILLATKVVVLKWWALKT